MAVNDDETNVVTLRLPGHVDAHPYRELDELFNDIMEAVMEHSGRIPLMGTIGVLETVKFKLIADARDEDPEAFE